MFSELIVLGTLFVGFLIGRMISSNHHLSSKQIENKLDAIIEHLGIDFQPYKNTLKEVYEALEQGQRIKAVKLNRQF